jgi:hypothetical protein
MDDDLIEWQTKMSEIRAKIQKHDRTYNDGSAFLDDMRNGILMEQFFLSEGAFQEIVGEIAASKQIAAEVNAHGVLIAIAADRGQELGGILELAEQIASE